MHNSFVIPEMMSCAVCYMRHEPEVPANLAEETKATTIIAIEDGGGLAILYRDILYRKVQPNPNCVCAIAHRLRWCAALERWREEVGRSIDLPLSRALERMSKQGAKIGVDFAPLSFSFEWAGMWGGLIFHGSHDGNGGGDYPSFSVCLTPTDGWSTHT